MFRFDDDGAVGLWVWRFGWLGWLGGCWLVGWLLWVGGGIEMGREGNGMEGEEGRVDSKMENTSSVVMMII